MYQSDSFLPDLAQESLLQEFLETLPLPYKTMVAIAYFTSSRINDILSLKTSDIYPNQIKIAKSEPSFNKLVPITPLLRPYLTIYLNGLKPQKSAFLFVNSQGEPLKSWVVFRVLNMTARQINLPEIYFFILR
ncbi:tyrosine-type recombinase/integrase [cyanobacterium endosymbiont of Rhopalodia gibberula]|uniref:tyrosine-type recombinase/integrase n=1 Tax=cyanobacterium endosymbiont of Rhopalodia gibberula TaxID=1763363 RepID=UPI000E64A643|nr:tyrosine-type recombinase/integrase [cyanobacterium endosymbiont of Rhopalodia gibberula]